MLPKRRHTSPPKWAWSWSRDCFNILPFAVMQRVARVRPRQLSYLYRDARGWLSCSSVVHQMVVSPACNADIRLTPAAVSISFRLETRDSGVTVEICTSVYRSVIWLHSSYLTGMTIPVVSRVSACTSWKDKGDITGLFALIQRHVRERLQRNSIILYLHSAKNLVELRMRIGPINI